MEGMVKIPFAYCCAEGGGDVRYCDCVNKNHGTAWSHPKDARNTGDLAPARDGTMIEEIAQIIFPEAWQEGTPRNNAPYRQQVFAEARAEAMRKARKIAALATRQERDQ